MSKQTFTHRRNILDAMLRVNKPFPKLLQLVPWVKFSRKLGSKVSLLTPQSSHLKLHIGLLKNNWVNAVQSVHLTLGSSTPRPVGTTALALNQHFLALRGHSQVNRNYFLLDPIKSWLGFRSAKKKVKLFCSNIFLRQLELVTWEHKTHITRWFDSAFSTEYK